MAEETLEAAAARTTEEEAEKETDQTEMEEAEVEETMEKEANATSLEIKDSANSETGADSDMMEPVVEVADETDHQVEKAEATAEEEETAAEEEAAARASEASQLIPALHQVSQCHLRLIT